MPSATVATPRPEEEQIRELNRMLQRGAHVLLGPHNKRIELPESVFQILKDAVRNMAAGRPIKVVRQNRQLTTQAAADILGFSRPHLIKLLESGAIPFQKVGQHRRVSLKDVKSFQKKRDAERRAALDRLARDEFEEGMYEGTAIPSWGSDE